MNSNIAKSSENTDYYFKENIGLPLECINADK